jgi:hypothetical protein
MITKGQRKNMMYIDMSLLNIYNVIGIKNRRLKNVFRTFIKNQAI